MNSELLRQKLVAAGRAADPPSDRVPYAFEKRIMARLAGRTFTDPWSAVATFLWRAVLPCCALMLVVGATTLAVPISNEDLGAQLDAVLLADLDTSADSP